MGDSSFMNIKKIVFFFLLMLMTLCAFTQEVQMTEATPSPEEFQELTPLQKNNLQLLKWGLDSQIAGFIKDITDKKDSFYKDAILELHQTHRNADDFSPAIIAYFSAIEFYGLYEFAMDKIRYYEDEVDQEIIPIIKYSVDAVNDGAIAKVSDMDDALWNLYQYGSDLLGNSAIEALGDLKSKDYLPILQREFEDPYAKIKLKPAMILAIGEIGGNEAKGWVLEKLNSEITKDERLAFSQVLAKLGDESVVDVLVDQMNQDNPFLRLKIMESLEGFSREVIMKFVDIGLKDSFWRVRLAAIKKCEQEKLTEFVPELIFKSKTDPENNIKNHCFRVIGILQTQSAQTYLSDIFFDEGKTDASRKTALKSLLLYPVESYHEPLLTWVKNEKNQKTKLYSGVVSLIGNTEQAGLTEFYEVFLANKLGQIQHAAVIGMEKNKVIINEARLREIYEKNSKNYLGTSIKKILPTVDEVSKMEEEALEILPNN